jgi:site-specific DNA-methyltransferase (adenine-specific)
MPSSPIYSPELIAKLYRDNALRKTIAGLEDLTKIEDESETLAKLVNTGISKSESLSRWVRYREGYSPTIVKTLLEKFPVNMDDSYIIDPMCGSGSTQVAAQQLGLASAGTDVSPYAVLVSKVKTTNLTAQEVEQIEGFRSNIALTTQSGTPTLNETETHLLAFFPQQNLRTLVNIKRDIQHKFGDSTAVRDFLLVALLAIVEVCANRFKDGNGLASRPSKVTNVATVLDTQIEEMLADLASADWMETQSLAFLASALSIDKSILHADQILGKKLGAVIFSPPYANSFDYYESYKLELLFGDFFTVGSISLERKKLIRSYRQMGKSEKTAGLDTVELLISELMELIPAKEAVTGKRDGRSRLLPNMLRGYFEDMDEFLAASARSMPKGSYMAIVADQSAYLGVPIPTDLLLAEIALKHGFEFEKLVICRRAKTSGQQLNSQPLLREVLRESAVILRR